MPLSKAVIVAGGKGTRIHSLTGNLIPKALVPVAEEPVVFRQLRLLSRYGVQDVAVMAGFLADVLHEKMQPQAEKLGMNICFFIEEDPLGTAGGLLAAKDFLGEDDFLVVYCDVVMEMDLRRLITFHNEHEADITIVAHPNDHPYESDLLTTNNEHRILHIIPRKQTKPAFYHNLVPASVYCTSNNIFSYIETGVKQDFIADIVPKMIGSGSKVLAYNTPEYLRDMGTPQRYEMTVADIESGLVERMNYEAKRPAIFFDRDGVLVEDPFKAKRVPTDKLMLIEGAGKAVKAVNDAGLLAVVVTNQPHIAKGFLSFKELDDMHAKLEMMLGYEHAKLDRIYFCPHHPQKGFKGEVSELKVDCPCRKPRFGMVEQAMRELPIRKDESCVLGDTWRDVGLARRSGLYAYGVRTGMGSRDCTGKYRPDLIFSNVFEAVTFAILGHPRAHALAETLTAPILAKVRHFVVGICGIARSGKSTLGHSLAKEFRKRGIGSLHVKLDDWNVPISERQPGSTVEERQQAYLYDEILTALLEGKQVISPGYDPFTREIVGNMEYNLNNAKVVILDGLLSCHKDIRSRIDYAIYTKISSNLFLTRFHEFYEWKGLSHTSICALFSERELEDVPVVLEQSATADEIVVQE